MPGRQPRGWAAGMRARWQTTRTMDLAENSATACICIVPDHVTLRCHPFETVVHATILTAVRPLRIVKRARMRVPEPWQDLVEPLRRCRPGAMTSGQRRRG